MRAPEAVAERAETLSCGCLVVRSEAGGGRSVEALCAEAEGMRAEIRALRDAPSVIGAGTRSDRGGKGRELRAAIAAYREHVFGEGAAS